MNPENKIRFEKTKKWIADNPVQAAMIASITIGVALKVAETRSSIRSRNAYAKQINNKFK